MFHLPEIRTVSDLARDVRALIERARQRQEPVIITQRGRDVAVFLPIELYRSLEERRVPRIVSPHLVHPEDAAKFRMEMTRVSPAPRESDAEV
jgi:prevent-host-death family protein